ncbi:MAG: aldo/keto reductase [Spirochaetales bacterium]|nr:aldo/keto reductase [Spirochaetales bacterium]
MDLKSTVALANGVEIPWVGLGVYLSKQGRETEQAVRWALEIGYRHIDTAALYENEEDVGKALRASGVPREEVFVTTKVWNSDQGYEKTLAAFDASRRKLGLEVVDLYLVHWPVKGKYRDTWRALEKLYAEGKVRAIGVSNFLVHQLEDLLGAAEVPPMVNQVEFHPFLVQKPLLEFGRRKEIRHQAWSPLTRGQMLQHEAISAVARKHGRTNAQVLIRWDLELGVVTIPKSVHRDRILENSRVFDFELDAEDMARFESLDSGTRIGPDPANFDF